MQGQESREDDWEDDWLLEAGMVQVVMLVWGLGLAQAVYIDQLHAVGDTSPEDCHSAFAVVASSGKYRNESASVNRVETRQN